MFLLIAHFGSLDFASVFGQVDAAPGLTGGFLTAICLLLFVGAAGKSAQIPLYVWLPDAMEGPTPVSALIHAATMVTAGVYMVARCHVLFDRSPFALAVVASSAAPQRSSPPPSAWSSTTSSACSPTPPSRSSATCFSAAASAAYAAGIFHLMTHAFFKALLFLAAGSVIHALSGEQDMRKMGGLRKRIPITFWTMTAGVFAIAGVPPFAGFFSKDEILYQTFLRGGPLGYTLWFVGLITAGLTTFYMFRLWFKTFFGEPRFDEAALAQVMEHMANPMMISLPFTRTATRTRRWSREPSTIAGRRLIRTVCTNRPAVMRVPLAILAVLSFIGGWVGVPPVLGGHNEIEHFLDPVFNPAEHVAEHLTSRGARARSLPPSRSSPRSSGFYFAYVLYYRKPGTAAALAERFKPLYNLLEQVLGRRDLRPPDRYLRCLCSRASSSAASSTGSSFRARSYACRSTRGLGWLARRMQSGNIRSYAGWLALGAAVVIAIVLFVSTRRTPTPDDPMNLDHSILTLLLLTPLVGAIIVALIPDRGEGSKLHHIIALASRYSHCCSTLHLPAHFDTHLRPLPVRAKLPWIASPAIHYHLGVDGLSMWLVVLRRSRSARRARLLARHQVAHEALLHSLPAAAGRDDRHLRLARPVPLLRLLGALARSDDAAHRHLRPHRKPAPRGDQVLPLRLHSVGAAARRDDLALCADRHLRSADAAALAAQHAISTNATALLLCSLAFLFAFAVKVPIFPLHGWLSDAVHEAPTAAVMVLAGKLGLYSILRFSFAIFPEQSRHIAPLLIALGAIGIVYGALLALVQNDLKKLAAFSTLRANQLHRARHLHLHHLRPRWRHLPDSQRILDRRCTLHAPGPAL